MEPLLTVSDLRIQFHGALRISHALNGASFRLAPGETLGLLGESGCGKSTLAKALLRLLPANAHITAGAIRWEGLDLLALKERELEALRGKSISFIPQEPGLALNPFRKIGKQIAEVLRVHEKLSWKACCEKAEELLRLVHLHDGARRLFDAYPHQLSGGQQQRVAIAQAISCGPMFVIADEPTASLDSTTEAEILELLGDLKARNRMAILLITHDPRILAGLANRIAVMYAGRIVEENSAAIILDHPLHPYARALMSCARLEQSEERLQRGERLPAIRGNSPDSETPPHGCAFAPRCDSKMDVCEQRTPCRTEHADSSLVECFLYER
jgi:oligopeptide/dipeptide ABC transporter ATP-binding protein